MSTEELRAEAEQAAEAYADRESYSPLHELIIGFERGYIAAMEKLRDDQ